MPTKVDEDFTGRVAHFVEELKAERFVPVEMAGFAEREHGSQLPAADVHIERFCAHVQETVFVAERAKLTEHFDRRSAIREDHVNIPKRFEGVDDFLPTREVEFVGGVAFQGAQDFHLGDSQSVCQHESHLSPVVIEGLANGLMSFIRGQDRAEGEIGSQHIFPFIFVKIVLDEVEHFICSLVCIEYNFAT